MVVMMPSTHHIALWACLGAILFAWRAESATINVACCNFGDVTNAIATSNNNDVIVLGYGTYSGVCNGITMGGMAKSLTLDGGNSLFGCTDSSSAAYNAFNFANEGPGDVIRNINLQPAYGRANATAFYIANASPTFLNVDVSNFARGINIISGSVQVTNSNFHDNGQTADPMYNDGACVHATTATVTISGTNFTRCSAPHDGGAVWVQNTVLNMANCLLVDNTANSDGGGVRVDYGATATISSSVFSSHHSYHGSGISQQGGSTAVVTGCSFNDGRSSQASGMVTAGVMNITGSTFSGNQANDGIGALWILLGANVHLLTTTFSFNSGGGGGSIAISDSPSQCDIRWCNFIHNDFSGDGNQRLIYATNEAVITVSHSYFQGGAESLYADNNGYYYVEHSYFTRGRFGLINTWGPPTTIMNCTFFNMGQADNDMGVIHMNGPTTVIGCTFLNNTVDLGVVRVNAPTTVSGSTFFGNTGRTGGAIYITKTSLAVFNCSFLYNTARPNSATPYGGAIYIGYENGQPVPVTVDGCRFVANQAGGGSAILVANAQSANSLVAIRNCVFSQHSSGNLGGAMLVNGYLSVVNCSFSDGVAYQGGALAATSSTTIEIIGCSFARVTSNFGGGALLLSGGLATLANMTFSDIQSTVGGAVYCDLFQRTTIFNCSFIHNQALSGVGGAIYMVQGSVYQSYFYDNTAATHGGAIGSTEIGLMQISTSTFVQNKAMINGGAICSAIQGAISVHKITAYNNLAGGNGGAVCVNYVTSTFTMLDSTITNNIAYNGGGLYVGAVMTAYNGNVSGSIFNNNQAQNGGGIYAGGYLDMSDSTVNSNTAAAGGGGVYSGDALVITGGTIVGNSVTGDGGGIYCRLCFMQLRGGLRVTNNIASDGGGFWCNTGSSFDTDVAVVFQSNTQEVTPSVSNDCKCGCCAVPTAPVTITTADCLLANNRSCGYTCAVGYTMGSPASVFSCDTSKTVPTFVPPQLCIPIPCPQLTAPANCTMVVPAHPATGDVAAFTCFPGYSLIGVDTNTCLGPNWIGVPPTCSPNPCPVLVNPSNGKVSNLTGVYGNVVSFKCNAGFSLQGASFATCLNTGVWSDAVPTCEARFCPPLPAPMNGSVSGPTAPRTQDVYNFYCNPGFFMLGNTSSVCLGGNWSSIPPSCFPSPCPTMPAPINGSVSNPNATTGSFASFACDLGFYLNGPPTLNCYAPTWIGQAPTCEPAFCASAIEGDLVSDCSPIVGFNAVCNFACVAGTAGTPVPASCQQTLEEPRGVFEPALPVCSPCAVGSYSLDGAVICTECANGGRTLGPRSGSQGLCLCAPNFYEATPGAGDCIDCPTGGSCAGGKDRPIAAPGYFENAGAFVACTPLAACTGSNQCGVGYTGFLCGSCSKGFYQLNDYCHVCPNDGPWRIVLVVLAGLVIVRALIAVVKPEAFSERTYGFVSVTIALSFLQIVATFSELNIQWPSGARTVFDIFSAFNLNIEVLNAECVTPLDFWDKTEIVLLLPIIVLAMFIVVGASMVAYHAFRERPDRAKLKEYALRTVSLCAAAFLMFLTLAYLFLAKAALSIFACQDQGGGIYTLRTSPSSFCYQGTWYRLLPLCIFGIIAYIIAVPIVVHAVYLRGRRQYGDTVARKSLFSHFLVNKYRTECWFWEVAVMLRKLLITIVATFGVGDTYGQVAASFAVILVSVLVSLPWHPYRWRKHNIVECISLFASLGVLFCGLLLSTKSTTLPPSVVAAIDAASIICVVIALMVLGACLALELKIYAGVLSLRTKLQPDRVQSLQALNSRIVLIAPYRTTLLTVSNEGSVRSWHQDSLLPARAFEMKESVEHAVVRGSELFFSRGRDLVVWELDLQASLETKKVDSSITSIACSEQYLVTGHESGELLFWPFRRDMEAVNQTMAITHSMGSFSRSTRGAALDFTNPVFITDSGDTEGASVQMASVSKPDTFGLGERVTVRAHGVAVTTLKQVGGLVVYSADTDGYIRKWSTTSFKHLRQWQVTDIPNDVTITAVEELTARLVVGLSNGVLRSMSVDAESTDAGRSMRWQIQRISHLTLCKDMLLSASSDGRIIVLNGSTEALLQMLPVSEASITALTVLEGGALVYGDARGMMRRYQIIPEWHMKEPDPHLLTQLWNHLKQRFRKDAAMEATKAAFELPDAQHDIYDELSVLAQSLDLPAIPWRVLDSTSAEAVALALAGETQKRRDHSDAQATSLRKRQSHAGSRHNSVW